MRKLRYIDSLGLSHFGLNVGLSEKMFTLPSLRAILLSCPCELFNRWRCNSPMSNVTSLEIQGGGFQPGDRPSHQIREDNTKGPQGQFQAVANRERGKA